MSDMRLFSKLDREGASAQSDALTLLPRECARFREDRREVIEIVDLRRTGVVEDHAMLAFVLLEDCIRMRGFELGLDPCRPLFTAAVEPHGAVHCIWRGGNIAEPGEHPVPGLRG